MAVRRDGANGGMMKSLKTILIGTVLAAIPGMAAAQAQVGSGPIPLPAITGKASAAAATYAHLAAATGGVGQPVNAGYTIQGQVTEIGRDALWMHNVVLMPIITLISLFVLALLLWVIVRYRASANPNPSRTSHNTTIEVIWTLAPVLILLFIAVPSIKLLAKQYSPPKADLTVKVIGNQWYWTYQYPDNGDFEIVSNMLPEGKRKASDGPRQLAVDERMVIPAGKVVKFITTSNDVIHSFAVPAFWLKMDAVPGRLNETWAKVDADKSGVYFGQCSELCGARHGYMPIAVEVVPPAQFAAWVHSKGGTMPGEGPAKPNPDATATSPAAGAAPSGAAPSGSDMNTPAPATPGVAKAVGTNQSANAVAK